MIEIEVEVNLLKQEVIDFFDSLAPGWDARQILNEGNINTILDNAGVGGGQVHFGCCLWNWRVGALVPGTKSGFSAWCGHLPRDDPYRSNNHQNPKVSLIHGDIEEINFDRKFDCAMIFNSFPHFPEPERLVEEWLNFLEPGGSLSVGHSMSRVQIDQCHSGSAKKVSLDCCRRRN
jgi:SAM-dependent methyltransferase